MKSSPPTPSIEEAPAAVVDSGHLWIIELVAGEPLRFSVDASGLLTFGDADRTFAATDVPKPYRLAVSHVRSALDRDALRAAVDDVSSVTFCGRVPVGRTVDYDWSRTPPFLGYDVWSGSEWLPPDAVERVYEALGLAPAAVVDRERRARDYTPGTDGFPPSAYYDGPVAGVLVRNKAGGRACRRNDAVLATDPPSAPPAVDRLVDRFTASQRLERLRADVGGAAGEDLVELVLAAMYREVPRVFEGPDALDEAAVRAAVARQLGPAGQA